MKKFLALIVGFTLFVSLGFSAPKLKMKTYSPDEATVRLLGRTVYKNKTAVMAHSATGVEFNVNAKKLTATLEEDSWSRPARIVAFLNGERIFDEVLKSAKKEFVIFESEEEKTGVVQILKASECLVATVGLSKLSTDVDGSISPTEPKKLKIEFVGDSATAAYGVDESNPRKHNSVETEDITKSYAYKTAQALNADYSIICGSGWGVVSGFTPNGVKNDRDLIPNFYDKVGLQKDVYVSSVMLGQTKWDFENFKSDLIVVLLGANDNPYTQNNAARKNEFKDAYVAFIKDIRAKNPDSYILCCIGIAPDELFAEVNAAVTEYKSETGDKAVSYFRIDRHNGELDGVAADWHPTDKAYTTATKQLLPEIKSILKIK